MCFDVLCRFRFLATTLEFLFAVVGWVLGIGDGDHGGDFNETMSGLADAEAACYETAFGPWIEDGGEMVFDFSVCVTIELAAGIDEALNGCGIDGGNGAEVVDNCLEKGTGIVLVLVENGVHAAGDESLVPWPVAEFLVLHRAPTSGFLLGIVHDAIINQTGIRERETLLEAINQDPRGRILDMDIGVEILSAERDIGFVVDYIGAGGVVAFDDFDAGAAQEFASGTGDAVEQDGHGDAEGDVDSDFEGCEDCDDDGGEEDAQVEGGD